MVPEGWSWGGAVFVCVCVSMRESEVRPICMFSSMLNDVCVCVCTLRVCMVGHTCLTAVACEADFDACFVAFVSVCIFLHVRVRGHLLYPAFSHFPNPHSGLSVCLRRQRLACLWRGAQSRSL